MEHHMLRPLLLALGLLFVANTAAAQSAYPKGHAHNDYEHHRPLHDALERGFSSIEVDIWLSDGALLVGHDESDLDPDRTIETLYLEPLREWAGDKGRRDDLVNGSAVTLLVDIKSDGEATYDALSELLVRYTDMLTRVEGGVQHDGAVRVVVSGNRPRSAMYAHEPRFAFYDGRLSDLDGGLAPYFMPLVSDNWTKHFSWTGAGEMPSVEREKLNDIIDRAHAKGYEVRFWGTPDRAGPARDSLWKALAEAGVDFINTDDLLGYEAFSGS
jgi:glycerophosphoryl diester phosphodiesterase